MLRRLAPMILAVGCSSCSSEPSRAWSQRIEFPADVESVVSAVQSLPECEAVRRGGVIQWRARITDCGAPVEFVGGCAFPFEDPPRVEVVLQGSAWDGKLAHELCHVCGYVEGPDRGQFEADACAMRARAAGGRN